MNPPLTLPGFAEILESNPDLTVLDARLPDDYTAGHIPESVNDRIELSVKLVTL